MTRTRALLTLPLAALALATTAVPASAAEHDPVIFIHGWNSSGSAFTEMAGDFQNDGYSADELLTWSYDTKQSNEITAQQLAGVVDDMLASTGASRVDIVTHSMGGLNSRWYVKFNGGADKVDDWVSLGGPNHGTNTANLCGDQSCVEMRENSAFLNTLNEGDETPGAPNYGTWSSPCDEVINPDSSVALSGANNTRTACMSHSALRTDDTVSAQVRSFVA